jgi:phage baseplate assembly protein W
MADYRQQDIEVPHFSLPFRFGSINNAAYANEQDDGPDLIDSIKLILSYPIGSREDMPEFGYPELLFGQTTTDNIVDRLRAAILRWEPRADTDVQLEELLGEEFVRKLLIRVRGSIPS